MHLHISSKIFNWKEKLRVLNNLYAYALIYKLLLILYKLI